MHILKCLILINLFQNSPLIIVIPLEHVKHIEKYNKNDKINVNNIGILELNLIQTKYK